MKQFTKALCVLALSLLLSFGAFAVPASETQASSMSTTATESTDAVSLQTQTPTEGESETTGESTRTHGDVWATNLFYAALSVMGVAVVAFLVYMAMKKRASRKPKAQKTAETKAEKEKKTEPDTAQQNVTAEARAQKLMHTTQAPEHAGGETLAPSQEFADTQTPASDAPATQTLPEPMLQVAHVHHIGKRKYQEDSFGVSDLTDRALCEKKGVLAVVADGMGGLKGGKDVSSLIVLRMLQGFADGSDTETDPDEELSRLLDDAVRSVNRHLTDTIGLRQGGSTLLAVIYRDGGLSFTSVGDSRTAVWRDGKLTDLHERHNFATELRHMVQQNKITQEQAETHPDRAKLTSFIGMGDLRYVAHSDMPLQLLPGDKVILMSDGVFNTLSDSEIEQVLSLPIDRVGESLEQAVLHKENPYQDNFTAIVLEVPQDAAIRT